MEKAYSFLFFSFFFTVLGPFGPIHFIDLSPNNAVSFPPPTHTHTHAHHGSHRSVIPPASTRAWYTTKPARFYANHYLPLTFTPTRVCLEAVYSLIHQQTPTPTDTLLV